MKFTKPLIALLCSCVLLCGCAKNSDTAIKINDGIITRGQFYTDFTRIKNIELRNIPKDLQKDDNYLVLALKERYVNDVITRELLAQEFAKRKIEASEDEIKAKKEQVINRIGSKEQFENILKQNGITEQRLNEDMASEVKMDKLVASFGINNVSNSEIEKFYKQNKNQFYAPERVRVYHILIDTNYDNIKRKITDADKKAKLSNSEIEKQAKEEVQRKEKLALDVHKKAVANPKQFSALAIQYSEDEATAKNGGDLGLVPREALIKEISDVAFNQKINTVSAPIKSNAGTHIIIVTDKAAAGLQSLDSVKDELRGFLLHKKRVEQIQKLLDGLRANAKIEFVDISLSPDTIRKQIQELVIKQQEKQQKSAKKNNVKSDMPPIAPASSGSENK